MNVSYSDWKKYINKLSKLSKLAGEQMTAWVNANGLEDRQALIEYANALVNKYGEGSAELACQMYDAIAELENVYIPIAQPAEVAKIGEVAKAINGSLKQSNDGALINSVVQRLVKQAGADTTLKNVLRDGAQFAWIPSGDTCSYCLALASNGWQYASKQTIRKGHAEHIHGNCDCQYAIRFNEKTNYDGYNPKEYAETYNNEPGKPKDKINALRRKNYEQNKERILAQQREAYARRKANKEDE